MKIIVLTGACNRGKTCTLYLVHEKLILHGGKVSNHKHIGDIDQRDFSDVVTYKRKKIAVFTMGDLEDKLCNAIKSYKRKKCDFLICACNRGLKEALSYIKTLPFEIYEKTKASDLIPAFEANLYDSCRILAALEKNITT
jgi:hypothetical protein